MGNHRKHPRFSPLLIRADYSLELGQGIRKGYVTNLSYGGAFLATQEDIPVGSHMKLLLSLPWQMGQLEVEAKVVWRRAETISSRGNASAGVGLQFVDLPEEARKRLQEYLVRFEELAASVAATL